MGITVIGVVKHLLISGPDLQEWTKQVSLQLLQGNKFRVRKTRRDLRQIVWRRKMGSKRQSGHGRSPQRVTFDQQSEEDDSGGYQRTM